MLKEVGEHGEVARRLLNPGPFFPCPANQGPTKFLWGATRKATDGKKLCLDLALGKCITAYAMLLEHLNFSVRMSCPSEVCSGMTMLREERHNFGVPVLEYRKDLAAQRDKLFCHQKDMAEGHASQLQPHGASRAEALGEIRARARQGACGAGQVRAHAAAELVSKRSRLQDVSASCAACSCAISLLHKEMAFNRENAKCEAAELASRSGQLEKSARHPRRTA
ncbi:hypothetical protein T492DRAFT_943886 [Pavlovales sp. CCMP2436]|nr:hypothetical protein T492DRAFT_943886 [Pavlovales sp. CCMP2436]